MTMAGSKMSETEYDLKVMMYPAYDTSHKLQYKGNNKFPATQITTQ